MSVIITGVVIMVAAFVIGIALYYATDNELIPICAMVLIIIGAIISLIGLTLYKQNSYEIAGQYVTVYTENTSVKYIIDPVTETEEEFFESLKEKGYTEYGKKDAK